jgi:hypothetical protein
MDTNIILIVVVLFCFYYFYKKYTNRKNKQIIQGKQNKFVFLKSDNNHNDNISNNNDIIYDKKYLKHDIISPNPDGTTESYHIASEPGKSWTDENVSQHPKYYRKNFENERTNVGEFFNKQNNLVDNTSPQSLSQLPDRCMINTNNQILCDFNNKLQNIPPKSYHSNKELINSIGQENNFNIQSVTNKNITNVNNNNYNSWSFDNEKTLNGGDFYNGIKPSSQLNEVQLNIENLPKYNYSL